MTENTARYWMQKHAALEQENAELKAENSRLKGAMVDLLDYSEEPPAKNCSCHINPPCGDCVAWSMLRDARDAARALSEGECQSSQKQET